MTTSKVTAPNSETGQSPSRGDTVDQLTQRLAHLEAMLHNTCGASFDGFSSMHAPSRDAYLHACYTTAAECSALAGELRP